MSTATATDLSGGTGARLGHIAIVLAGIAALAATLLTILSVWLQSKNYRKPLLQRYVIRILCMVPIYSGASWASLVSLKAAFWIDPFRDIYEAFTIYAFFQLLINFIGGERSLIILMHGRKPVSHPWPLSQCLAKVDISDPHTFLAIKRGILQYTWMKPALSIATIAMKATGTYKEGYIGLTSGYFWSGLIYNISISVSLYALAMFWVCMSIDLQPFRPMPKFLSIKGIIFASYWQGFFLSILVWLGAVPSDIPGYSPDNLAASIQDALICFEMPLFAILHWYAFSWHDYADVTISAARMPVKYALRDAFGPVDLIQDAKETFAGDKYQYRYFDAGDDILAHEESHQRVARMNEGMRYERGKGKYWIPDPHHANPKTPLLGRLTDPCVEPHTRASSHSSDRSRAGYGATSNGDVDEVKLDDEEELLYTKARELEFGDWNYPVITAHEASREDRLYRTPGMVTASTNRHLLQSTKANKSRRKSRIEDIQKTAGKAKDRPSESREVEEGGSSSRGRSKSKAAQIPVLGGWIEAVQGENERSESRHSDKSQLVDLVVEDKEAEDIDRVRARKEGSPGWNRHEAKHFVRAYPDSDQEEAVRVGYEPGPEENQEPQNQHTLDAAFAVGDDDDSEQGESSQHLKTRHYNGQTEDEDEEAFQEQVGGPTEAQDEISNPWASPKR